MNNILSLAITNKMMTDESRKAYKSNRFATSEELEGTIRLKFRTIEKLRELSTGNNNEDYNSIIMRLIRSYRKERQ